MRVIKPQHSKKWLFYKICFAKYNGWRDYFEEISFNYRVSRSFLYFRFCVAAQCGCFFAPGEGRADSTGNER